MASRNAISHTGTAGRIIGQPTDRATRPAGRARAKAMGASVGVVGVAIVRAVVADRAATAATAATLRHKELKPAAVLLPGAGCHASALLLLRKHV